MPAKLIIRVVEAVLDVVGLHVFSTHQSTNFFYTAEYCKTLQFNSLQEYKLDLSVTCSAVSEMTDPLHGDLPSNLNQDLQITIFHIVWSSLDWLSVGLRVSPDQDLKMYGNAPFQWMAFFYSLKMRDKCVKWVSELPKPTLQAKHKWVEIPEIFNICVVHLSWHWLQASQLSRSQLETHAIAPPQNLDHLSEQCLRFLPPFHQSHMLSSWARMYSLPLLPFIYL